MNPITVRDARGSDAEAIAQVARASWTDTYRDIFDADFIADFLKTNYATEALAQQADRATAREATHFLVAERDGAVIGFAQYGRGPSGPELFRIYADPGHYGTGVGSALLAELHRRLRGRVDAYILHVHSRNVRGRAFYDRNGFTVVGSGSTPECDLTLRRTLTN